MKCKLIMLAILLLSFGGVQAADSVSVSIYDATNDVVLDPATDTIYTQDTEGADIDYQIRIAIESDIDISGMTLGFRLWSNDGVIWQYNAQSGGFGDNTEAVIVPPTSRFDPAAGTGSFDMTGLLVVEKDYDGMLDDSLVFGGVGLNNTLAAGPMEDMIAIHVTFGGVDSGQIKTFCIDSSFVPPAGAWIFTPEMGLPFPPGFAPAICFPVQRDPLSDVGDGKNAVPHVFELAQNYPNPFNPTTMIKYSVARKTHVNISIYNILGQNVVTLVNEEKDAGSVHEVVWDGCDDAGNPVSSGIFVSRLVAGNAVVTNRMTLVK